MVACLQLKRYQTGTCILVSLNHLLKEFFMTGKEFKEKLHQGEKLFGTCITQPSPLWTKIAREIKLDFVFIDTEHWPFSDQEVTSLCQIYQNMGIVPVVRIAHPNPNLASRALDWGALGVVAPYVETRAQVLDLVGAVKYAPLKGGTLEKGLLKNQWLPETREFVTRLNEQRSAIINIESTTALKNLSQLVTVPGLDALLIGPYDLSISLGVPVQYEHPTFLEAVATIITTARANGLGAGIHSWWSIEQDRNWMSMGLNLLIHASDYIAARVKLSADMKALRCDMIK